MMTQCRVSLPLAEAHEFVSVKVRIFVPFCRRCAALTWSTALAEDIINKAIATLLAYFELGLVYPDTPPAVTNQ